MRTFLSSLFLCLLSFTPAFALQPLVAVKTTVPAEIDGLATEAFWAQAKAVTVRDSVAQIDIQLKAAHDGETLYLLAEFPDVDESRMHRTLIWKPELNSYQNGPTREDTLVLKWSMSGLQSGLTLREDRPYRADIWYWKADRTDHAGYADDKIQHYTTTRDKKSLLLLSHSGKVFYLLRKGDRGEPAYKPKLQTSYSNDLVPKYDYFLPTGSRADVRAKGHWQDDRWVIEFARKLQTGQPDDLQMELAGSYSFGVSRFEIAGRQPEPATESDVALFGSGEVGELFGVKLSALIGDDAFFSADKNLGLLLLVVIQMVVTVLAFVQIRHKERDVAILSGDIAARYEVLDRVDRSLSAAANLFYYDSTDTFITPAGLFVVVDQAEMLSRQLLASNHDRKDLSKLQAMADVFPQLVLAIRFYAEAEKEFSSDREILANMIHVQIADLFNDLMWLQSDSQLMSIAVNRNLLESIDGLLLAFDDLFRRLEGTTVHQPEKLIEILDTAISDIALLAQRYQHGDGMAGELKRIKDDIRLLKLNLLGIYNVWTYDPNLSYLGDEIEKLARAWDRIQFSLNVIVDQENSRFAERRNEMVEYSETEKIRFSIMALLGLVTTLFLAVVLSRVLHRRLAVLAEGMKNYAAGDLDARLKVPDDDDLGQLNDAFNEMAGQLQRKDEELNQTIEVLVDSQAELHEAHSSLELRVAARTEELSQANEKLLLMGKVFDHAKEGILVADSQGEIVKVNPEFCRMTGFGSEQVLGKHPGLFRQQGDPLFNDKVHGQLLRQGSWEGELDLNTCDGNPLEVLASISQYTLESGAIAGYIAVYHDIRELKEQEKMIRYQAYHDALTGLPNRTLLADRLQIAISHAQRNHDQIGVLFLDLDDFKKINDSFGHGFGDNLLKRVADILTEIFRQEDTISRIGGDEFVVVLGDSPDRARIHNLAERVLERVSGAHTILGREVHIGVSIGMATYPENGATVAELLKNADIAMYSAKEHGKNVIHAFTQSMDEKTQMRLALEEAVWAGLENEEFELYFQPQFNADGSRLCGVECLVRWNHPQRGLVAPAEFISLCEETGQIIPLGTWVLEAACRYAVAFQAMYRLPNIRFYVNVSPKQFGDKNFLEIFHRVLKTTGLDPKFLGIEITESSMMSDVEYALQVVEELNRYGVAVAIDDFGTGYSSLQQLKNFPIRILKIDRSFVMDLPGDLSDEKIVETIIGMAQQLEMETVAEGVETLEQLQLLQKMGCSKLQGYLFSRPVAAAEFEAFVRDGFLSESVVTGAFNNN